MACSINVLEEGIRNAENEKVQLLQEISEQVRFSTNEVQQSLLYDVYLANDMLTQEKELQLLQRSLEALSGKPCTIFNTQHKTQGSACTTMEACQRPQGPWQPAHGSEQHLKHRNMGKDLWPDDDVLPEKPDSASHQPGSGDGQQKNKSACPGIDQPHRLSANLEPHLSQYPLPKELDSRLSSVEQRSEQHQPYIVTEPDSPKVSSEAPTRGSLSSHQMNQNALPIIYTEMTVTR